MKYILKLFTIFALAASLVSCKSQALRDVEALVGDWHYAAEESGVKVDIWVSFFQNGTFQMYQLVGEGAYWRSTGSYEADSEDSTIYGRYSDKTPWAHTYKFAFESGKLVLTAVDMPTYVVKYNRETVPASVKEKALDLTKSGAVDYVPFL